MISPKISVIIPTCDRPELLLETVKSVKAQTYSPEEIIIVDNGLEQIPNNSAVFNLGIKYIRALPRFGVAQARNVGSIVAKGDYLAFLDDDDLWDYNYLEAVTKTLQETGASIVLGVLKSMSSGKVMKKKSEHIPDKNKFITELLRRNPGVIGSNTVIKKELFFSTPGYDPYLTTGQDKAIVLDLVNKNDLITVRAESAVVYFREDGTSVRQTELWKRIMGKRRFLKKYWKMMRCSDRMYVMAQLTRMYVKRISS